MSPNVILMFIIIILSVTSCNTTLQKNQSSNLYNSLDSRILKLNQYTRNESLNYKKIQKEKKKLVPELAKLIALNTSTEPGNRFNSLPVDTLVNLHYNFTRLKNILNSSQNYTDGQFISNEYLLDQKLVILDSILSIHFYDDGLKNWNRFQITKEKPDAQLAYLSFIKSKVHHFSDLKNNDSLLNLSFKSGSVSVDLHGFKENFNTDIFNKDCTNKGLYKLLYEEHDPNFECIMDFEIKNSGINSTSTSRFKDIKEKMLVRYDTKKDTSGKLQKVPVYNEYKITEYEQVTEEFWHLKVDVFVVGDEKLCKMKGFIFEDKIEKKKTFKYSYTGDKPLLEKHKKKQDRVENSTKNIYSRPMEVLNNRFLKHVARRFDYDCCRCESDSISQKYQEPLNAETSKLKYPKDSIACNKIESKLHCITPELSANYLRNYYSIEKMDSILYIRVSILQEISFGSDFMTIFLANKNVVTLKYDFLKEYNRDRLLPVKFVDYYFKIPTDFLVDLKRFPIKYIRTHPHKNFVPKKVPLLGLESRDRGDDSYKWNLSKKEGITIAKWIKSM